jgi:hypothetical protein
VQSHRDGACYSKNGDHRQRPHETWFVGRHQKSDDHQCNSERKLRGALKASKMRSSALRGSSITLAHHGVDDSDALFVGELGELLSRLTIGRRFAHQGSRIARLRRRVEVPRFPRAPIGFSDTEDFAGFASIARMRRRWVLWSDFGRSRSNPDVGDYCPLRWNAGTSNAGKLFDAGARSRTARRGCEAGW